MKKLEVIIQARKRIQYNIHMILLRKRKWIKQNRKKNISSFNIKRFVYDFILRILILNKK